LNIGIWQSRYNEEKHRIPIILFRLNGVIAAKGNKMHRIERKTSVSADIEEVFEFFSDAGNLERITPPELNFNIVTPRPFNIKKDALIEYRLGLLGFKFSWLTIISEWNPPYSFSDEQLKGPYKVWHHNHRFYQEGNKTIIEDEVNYKLPLYPLGEIAYPVINIQLNRIFNYRSKIIKELFG
jgi:ligand-binding SRPBCC domain-containing protein